MRGTAKLKRIMAARTAGADATAAAVHADADVLETRPEEVTETVLRFLGSASSR
jgi:hypothetical protein